MDKVFLRMQIRVITTPDEEPEQFQEALKFLYKDEKVPFPIQIDSFLNVREHKQHIITVIFEKARHVRYGVDTLFDKLTSDQINELHDQLDTRLDEECHFFIRFEKKAFLNGKFVLTQSGDCIHFMLSVAAYPSRKENDLPIVEKYLNAKIIK